MAWRPGVGNIAKYNEGTLRKKIKLYAKEEEFFEEVILTRVSGSTAKSSVLLGPLILGAKDGVNAGLVVSGSLNVSGSTTLGDEVNVGRLSGSTAGSSILLGDLILGAKNATDANVYVSGSVYVDKIRRASDTSSETTFCDVMSA